MVKRENAAGLSATLFLHSCKPVFKQPLSSSQILIEYTETFSRQQEGFAAFAEADFIQILAQQHRRIIEFDYSNILKGLELHQRKHKTINLARTYAVVGLIFVLMSLRPAYVLLLKLAVPAALQVAQILCP
ncbi:hypothetical protein ACFTAO_34090 [Paenibacillus rhizoplanae]